MEESYLYYCKGVCEYEKGNYQEAISFFLKSCSLMPHYKTFERLAFCYLKLNSIHDYERYIKSAYNLNTNNDKVATEYAEIISDVNTDSARLILSQVLKRNPTYEPAKALLDKISIRKIGE